MSGDEDRERGERGTELLDALPEVTLDLRIAIQETVMHLRSPDTYEGERRGGEEKRRRGGEEEGREKGEERVPG